MRAEYQCWVSECGDPRPLFFRGVMLGLSMEAAAGAVVGIIWYAVEAIARG